MAFDNQLLRSYYVTIVHLVFCFLLQKAASKQRIDSLERRLSAATALCRRLEGLRHCRKCEGVSAKKDDQAPAAPNLASDEQLTDADVEGVQSTAPQN